MTGTVLALSVVRDPERARKNDGERRNRRGTERDSLAAPAGSLQTAAHVPSWLSLMRAACR